MTNFRCTCGNSIVVDPPAENAGYIVWDSDVDRSIDLRRDELTGFFNALKTGQRDAWTRYFYGAGNQDRLDQKTDVDIVEDILSRHDSYTHIFYCCDACGNLLVQDESGGRHYRVYSPET